jgi:hypothetical protein
MLDRPDQPADRPSLRGARPLTISAANGQGETSAMRHASSEPPPRYRWQALARLDGLIARAERDLERRLAGEPPSAGASP